MTDVAELERQVQALRDEVTALRATIERMEGDIRVLFDKWTLPPELKAELERGLRR